MTRFSILLIVSGCASTPVSIGDTKHATWGTAANPEAPPAPYQDDLSPNSPLVTSSGLECEHCNVAEFTKEVGNGD